MTVFGAARTLRRIADDGSRWRCPVTAYGFHAVLKNVSAASELRWMRITASWSGSLTHRIEGCGTNIRALHAGSTLGCRHPDHNKCAVVLGAVKDEPYGGLRPSLTAPARAGP